MANYNHNLAILAAKKASMIFGTKILTVDPKCIGSMTNVEIPCEDANLCSEIAFKMLNDK